MRLPFKHSRYRLLPLTLPVIFGAFVACQTGSKSDGTVVEENPELLTVVAVSVGAYHVCALNRRGEDESVQCWGDNSLGQVGQTQTQCKFNACSPKPTKVKNLPTEIRTIAAGDTFSCALAKGEVICWGAVKKNRYGAPIKDSNLTKVSVLGKRVQDFRAGFGEIAAIIPLNESAPPIPPNAPIPPGSKTLAVVHLAKMERENIFKGPVADFELGQGHGCFLSEGQVRCWGGNDFGQLGIGSTKDSEIPVPVKNLPGAATKIAVGSHHACAVVNGAVWCWGQQFDDPPGESDEENKRKSETCAVEGDREVRCSSLPHLIAGLEADIVDIGAGERSTCAIANTGGLTCWGADSLTLAEDGKLADVPGLIKGVRSVDGGNNHTCALLRNQVMCWGFNTFGELGNGTTENSIHPVEAIGLTP